MEDQPREYYRRLVDMAMHAGQVMMSAGAETHRVEDTILHILATSQFSHADAFVLRTGITITLSDPRYKTISITRRLFCGNTNFNRVYEVNNVSRDFCAGKITLDQAEKKLCKIENETLYDKKAIVLAYMLACCGFSVVFGGGVAEALTSCICGFFLALENIFLAGKIKKSFISDLLGSVIITVVAVGTSFIAGKCGVNIACQYVVVGAIMPLVPGVAITNAIRDTLQGDYVSGVARIAEAFMIAASVALGVALGLKISVWLDFSVNFRFSLDGMNSLGWHGFAAIIAAFLAIGGFCVIFLCPKKLFLVICSVSSVCWFVYLIFVNYITDEIWATFFAAVAVDLISQILARKLKAPVTLFFIGGVLPLVPGYAIYRVAYDMILGESAGEPLMRTLLIAGTIALAVLVTDTFIDIIHRSSEHIKHRKLKKKS
ncbi:MAG: threonine/serine exporter ThrE family protein [Eubacteriales bacterium]